MENLTLILCFSAIGIALIVFMNLYCCFSFVKKNKSINALSFKFIYVAAAKESFNRVSSFFSQNKDKYKLLDLRLDGEWKNNLVIKYQIMKHNEKPIDFSNLLGRLLHE